MGSTLYYWKYYNIAHMTELLDNLHDDHKNFVKLLEFLESQLNCIKNCEVVDFELILMAMIYMKEYPDEVHHPQENIIFNYFLEHYKDSHDDILALMQEHVSMPQLTDRIIDMLESIVCETPINRDEFCEHLAKYIDVQKQHMNQEESAVYPAIYEHFKPDDWKNLNMQLDNVPDPLFHDPTEKKYSQLLLKVSTAM